MERFNGNVVRGTTVDWWQPPLIGKTQNRAIITKKIMFKKVWWILIMISCEKPVKLKNYNLMFLLIKIIILVKQETNNMIGVIEMEWCRELPQMNIGKHRLAFKNQSIRVVLTHTWENKRSFKVTDQTSFKILVIMDNFNHSKSLHREDKQFMMILIIKWMIFLLEDNKRW
jgi:hypothetical protein